MGIRPRVMIIGLGGLGGNVLEFLARTPGVSEIITTDINKDHGTRKTNMAMMGAAHQGFYPIIKFVEGDLNDIDGMAALLKTFEPDVVLNCTTLQSWWVILGLPRSVFEELDAAGVGPWLPMHLTLAYKFMQAFKKSGIKGHAVNSSFPDAVNPVLGKVGLAPTMGIGNLDLLIPGIKKVVGEKFGVPMHRVEVFLVSHHFLNGHLFGHGDTGGAPYFLKILVDHKDVTPKVNTDEILCAAGRIPRDRGPTAQQHTAGAAVKDILAILHDTGQLTHVPGPNGLVGGYPVCLGAKGVEIVLPEELTLEKAIGINEEAQKFDGVETIRDEGTVVFTDKAVGIMRRMLNYDCEELKISECEEKAKELASLYKKFAEKYEMHF